jgi:hypothetical protein
VPITPDVAEELDAETRVICECGHPLSRHFGCSYECLDCHCIDFRERPVKNRFERIQESVDGKPPKDPPEGPMTLDDLVSGRRKLMR